MGRAVPERLGFRYVDEEIVARAAEKQNIDPEVVADAEKRKSLLARVLEELGDAAWLEHSYAYGALATPGLSSAHATLGTSEGFRALIREVIHETAEQHYDLVINTDVLGPDRAAELVVRLASA